MTEIIVVDELPTGGFCSLCVAMGPTASPGTMGAINCPQCGRPFVAQGDGVVQRERPLQIPAKWSGRAAGAPSFRKRFLPMPQEPETPTEDKPLTRQQRRAQERKSRK